MSQAEIIPVEDISRTPQPPQSMTVLMNTPSGMDLLQRQAKLFATSSLVPPDYRIGGIVKEKGREVEVDRERAIANCSIALSMAMRIGVDPMAVFQNMYIIQGRPSFGSAFMIGIFNKTGKYSSLSYKFVGQRGADDYGCYAVCKRMEDGELIEGPVVTIGMAKKEGWINKPGSKWITMPDLMLRYRAAAFLIRTITPEVCLGLLTQEEAIDIAVDQARPVHGTATLQREKIQQRTTTVAALSQKTAQPQPKTQAQQQLPRQERPQQQDPAQQQTSNTNMRQAASGEQVCQPQPLPQQQPRPQQQPLQQQAPTMARQAQPQQQAQTGTMTCPRTNSDVTEAFCTSQGCTYGCPNWAEEL